MRREAMLNLGLALLLPALPLAAQLLDEPFYVTLATRMAILALAAAGLNLALGFGGLVSFGHAAFFGIGGYAAGILARHAFDAEPLLSWPFAWSGSDQMPVVWLVAGLSCALVALPIGAISLRTSGVYFIMITLAFAQMIYYFAISWPAYGGEDGLSITVRNGFPGVDTADPTGLFLVCYAVLMAALALDLAAARFTFRGRSAGRQAERSPRRRASASSRSGSGSPPWCFPPSSREWRERCLPISTASSAPR